MQGGECGGTDEARVVAKPGGDDFDATEDWYGKAVNLGADAGCQKIKGF